MLVVCLSFLYRHPFPTYFSKLFYLRMICPKFDSCCFLITTSNGSVALISSITGLLVRLAVHGIRSSLLQHHNSKLPILLLSAFLIVNDSQTYSITVKTNAFTILHFVVIVISLSFHVLLSSVIAALPNANRRITYKSANQLKMGSCNNDSIANDLEFCSSVSIIMSQNYVFQFQLHPFPYHQVQLVFRYSLICSVII